MTRASASRRLLVAVLMTAMLSSEAASAPMAASSVQVAGRVVSFLQPDLSGVVIAAIIYRPGDAASENEARAVERALGSGLVVGAMRLRSRRVAEGALDGLAGTRVAFVTAGSNYRAIASATSARSILTISSDPACARAGYCAVSISSTPRVQITVSRAATRAARLRFSSAFLMLVKEI